MPRPGIVGIRGFMVIRLRPCMNIEYTPPYELVQAEPQNFRSHECRLQDLLTAYLVSYLPPQTAEENAGVFAKIVIWANLILEKG